MIFFVCWEYSYIENIIPEIVELQDFAFQNTAKINEE